MILEYYGKIGWIKLRVIIVRTGDKYDQWYEDNIRHMIDKYSNLEYDSFEVIRDDVYDLAVANKLLMFDRYRDGQNIFFDIDVCIKGDCNKFIFNDLHVLRAWWRPDYHTPLNSSIISWYGDYSHIYEKWEEDPEYHMTKYYKGIDQFLYEQFNPKAIYYGFNSIQTIEEEDDKYDVTLFNQRHEYMKNPGWWSKYFIA